MTEDRPPDDESDEPRDDRAPDDGFPGDEPWDRPADAPDRSGGWLGTVLEVLDRLDRLSASGERRGDRSRIDYDVSVRSGLGDLESADRGGDRSELSHTPEGSSRHEDSGGHERRKRDFGPSTDRYPVSTQRDDDELLVSADVAGVAREDVTVGFDDGALVIGVEGSELDRVPVPWSDPAAKARMKNGVLSVKITAGGETDE